MLISLKNAVKNMAAADAFFLLMVDYGVMLKVDMIESLKDNRE